MPRVTSYIGQIYPHVAERAAQYEDDRRAYYAAINTAATGPLRCDPSEPRYRSTKLCDCTICPVMDELYGPPPEPGAEATEHEDRERGDD